MWRKMEEKLKLERIMEREWIERGQKRRGKLRMQEKYTSWNVNGRCDSMDLKQ